MKYSDDLFEDFAQPGATVRMAFQPCLQLEHAAISLDLAATQSNSGPLFYSLHYSMMSDTLFQTDDDAILPRKRR